jgi:hypothetical protein
MVMFINMEIPFREVAHESYHEFMSLVSPWFKICSRFTLSCDILKLWDVERIYLESFFLRTVEEVVSLLICGLVKRWVMCVWRLISLTTIGICIRRLYIFVKSHGGGYLCDNGQVLG